LKENPNLEDSSFRLAVLKVDMRHSTTIASKLNLSQQKFYYETFLNEMIAVLEDFGGSPFKTDGDCVIGFFPETSGFQWADNVILCGLMMIQVVENNLSPYVESKGFPKLECRIGADYGEAQIITFKSDKIPFDFDAIGSVLNFAAHIQEKADTNQMFIGQNLAELIYTDFRVCCEEKGKLDSNYKFFYVNYQI
jgi:class 3 adenylate cyclase